MTFIVQITKEESIIIRKQFPDLYVSHPTKNKKYSMTENFKAMQYLKKLRENSIKK